MGSLFLSCDSGYHFAKVFTGTGGGEILNFEEGSHTIYAASIYPPGLLSSKDYGNSWDTTAKADTAIKSYACSLICRESERGQQFVLSCSRPGIVLSSDDTGRSWTTILSGTGLDGRELPKVAGVAGTLAVCTTDAYDSTGMNCYLSYGSTRLSSHKNGFPGWAIDIDRMNPSRICIGYFGPNHDGRRKSCMYESLDRGNSWKGIDTLGGWYVWSLKYRPDGGLLAATDKGLLQLTPF